MVRTFKYNSIQHTLTSDKSEPYLEYTNVKVIGDQQTSDGFHTFEELYFHRMILFSVICQTFKNHAWKSWKHHDGTMYEDYFIVGVTTFEGDYSYHYHKDWWHKFDVTELPNAPVWDGHKPEDIGRLFSLLEENKWRTNE